MAVLPRQKPAPCNGLKRPGKCLSTKSHRGQAQTQMESQPLRSLQRPINHLPLVRAQLTQLDKPIALPVTWDARPGRELQRTEEELTLPVTEVTRFIKGSHCGVWPSMWTPQQQSKVPQQPRLPASLALWSQVQQDPGAGSKGAGWWSRSRTSVVPAVVGLEDTQGWEGVFRWGVTTQLISSAT